MKKFRMILLFFANFIALVFFLMIFGVLSFFSRKSSQDLLGSSSSLFEYTSIRKVNNRTREAKIVLGVVELERNILGSEDFIYFPNSNGSDIRTDILISRFGDEKYECHGSCYCEVSEESRRSSITHSLSKSFTFYLVAGVSSLVAYNRAKNWLVENCKNEVYCPGDSIIQSNVENCEVIFQKNSLEETTEDEEETSGIINEQEESEQSQPNTDDEKEEDKEESRFGCRGHCVSNHRLKQRRAKWLSRNARCFEMKMKRILAFDKKPSNRMKPENVIRKVQEHFQKKHLNPYCNEVKGENFGKTTKVMSKKYLYSTGWDNTYSIPLCSGGALGKNKSVKCVRL